MLHPSGFICLYLVRDGGVEEFHIEPESLGLGRAGGSDIPWRDEKDESSRIMAALISGERGAVRNLIAYNAALRLWMSKGGSASLEESAEKVRDALDSGTVAELMPDPGGKFHC